MKVFLSASVPLPGRDPAFLGTADVVAIREAVKGLVLVLLERRGQLVFGGHPAITPLVRLLFNEAKRSPREHVTMYQSKFFKREFPTANDAFERIRLTDTVSDNRESSLHAMRQRMLCEPGYTSGVFIGGMEGVIEEYEMFCEIQPNVPAFPIASTGAAAAQIYEAHDFGNLKLKDEFTYPTLFRKILPIE